MANNLFILTQSFLNFILTQKHYSKHTVINYKRDLKNFLAYLNQDWLDFEKFNFSSCRRYLYFLDQKKYSRKSIARMIASIRSFWNYLIFKKIVTNNPWKLLSVPKIEKKLPKVLNSSEMNIFLNAIDITDNLGKRNRAICELIYSSGLRISECINMNLEDIDFDKNEILIRGKGSKERIALFGQVAKKYLLLYLDIRKQLPSKSTNAVFLNKFGSRLTTRSVQRMIKNLAKKMNFSKKITPHTFRHSFATDLLEGGADLKMIQTLLGHSNLTTTQIYTHLTQEKLKKSFEKAHPHA